MIITLKILHRVNNARSEHFLIRYDGYIGFPVGFGNVNLNPPSVARCHRLTEISISILEGIIRKIIYESRAYESVDEKSPSLATIYMSRKTTKKELWMNNPLVLETFFLSNFEI